jgi:hypothetical protein
MSIMRVLDYAAQSRISWMIGASSSFSLLMISVHDDLDVRPALLESQDQLVHVEIEEQGSQPHNPVAGQEVQQIDLRRGGS